MGKTTVAAALALGLVQRGHSVHLSTTDPADHLAGTLNGEVPGLKLSRIDPKVETQRYIDKIMAAKAPLLHAAEQALLLEDLQSPCTEEVAVFQAFSRIVSEGRSAFVVLDTAPTGHSMLLMDATGAYHRQMTREFEGHGAARVVTPLMRLQDASYTRIILVTLPEVTPVSQAAALQEDLRRAGIEPCAWVLSAAVQVGGAVMGVVDSIQAEAPARVLALFLSADGSVSEGAMSRLDALGDLDLPRVCRESFLAQVQSGTAPGREGAAWPPTTFAARVRAAYLSPGLSPGNRTSTTRRAVASGVPLGSFLLRTPRGRPVRCWPAH